jgi:plastocyanin/nitrous oxidase accessory protein NosD
MRTISRIGLLLGLTLAALIALAVAAHAGTKHVGARDNDFLPQEIRIDPGDRVVWKNSGFREHTVTADDRTYDSGRMDSGDEFAHTYRKTGYYFYHCKLHGAARSGMWGVVVVGNPGPPGGRRPKLVVPDRFRTIQKAVDAARPGSTIVVKPGRYSQEVTVDVPDLVIKGVDRFRTILDGRDTKTNGITVDGFGEVTIKNLTIRNFTGSGIYVHDATDYTVSRVDLIKNRTFGVNVVGSNDGVIARSFGWGSGDSALRVADCRSCSTLVDAVQVKRSFIGLTLENVYGVVVRSSRFQNDGAGIVSMSTPGGPTGTNNGAHLIGNSVSSNNFSTVPEAGLSMRSGLPFGTGIWLAGTTNNVVEDNWVAGHDRYGILVTRSFDSEYNASYNEVVGNTVEGSGLFDLAWDGYGDDDCFADNVAGSSGPSDIQSTYACSERPFTGTPFAPVIDDVSSALVYNPDRPQEEPPEPNRPR